MCEITLNNSVVFEAKIHAGKGSYYLTGLQILKDKKILGVACLNGLVKQGTQGDDLADTTDSNKFYLTMVSIDCGKVNTTIDKYPLALITPTATDVKAVQPIKRGIYDMDKSFISVSDTSGLTPGEIVSIVLLYED